MTKFTPRGWHAGLVEHRLADIAASSGPLSYNAEDRSVDCIISTGSPVRRFYGTEVLRIDPQSVILERMASGIPLLDSHNQVGISNALGRVTETWFKRGALMGRLRFNDTPEGRKAEGMVARGEIAGISAGYCVREWQTSDSEGNVLDGVGIDDARWNDELTFTATSWELLEASLVSVPADSSAMIRSLGGGGDRHADVRARMLARERMSARQRMYDRQARVFGGDADD